MAAKGKDKILNTGQLAKFLAVSSETAARWCAEGRLPAFKIGGQWRVRQSDLNKIIRRKVEGTLRKGEAMGKPLF